jgi:hypothetical protein
MLGKANDRSDDHFIRFGLLPPADRFRSTWQTASIRPCALAQLFAMSPSNLSPPLCLSNLSCQWRYERELSGEEYSKLYWSVVIEAPGNTALRNPAVLVQSLGFAHPFGL